MKRYTYYPGCAMETTGKPIQASIDAVSKVLDIELIELPDWTCCGCPGESINELAAVAMASRNLVLAEKTGLDIVVPCSCCYRNLMSAHVAYTSDPELGTRLKKPWLPLDLRYEGTARIRNLVDVFVNDIGLDVIASKVRIPLKGLKVASYYGCHQSRPFGPDDFEFPVWQDQIAESLGAESVFFPLKAQCCGGASFSVRKIWSISYCIKYSMMWNVMAVNASPQRYVRCVLLI